MHEKMILLVHVLIEIVVDKELHFAERERERERETERERARGVVGGGKILMTTE